MAAKKKAGAAVRGAQKRNRNGKAAANLDVQANSMDPVFVFEDAQTERPQVSTEPSLVRSERRGRPKNPQRKAPPSRPARKSVPVVESSDADESNKIPTNNQQNGCETRLNAIEENLKDLASKLNQGLSSIADLMAKSAEKQTENPSLADLRDDLKCNNYKNKYILAQEMNGELHNENRGLRTKLEATLARVEGYEKGQQVLCETIGKVKDSCYGSCLAKTIGSALGGGSALGALINNDAPTSEALLTAPPSAGRNGARARRKAVEGEAAPAAARRKA